MYSSVGQNNLILHVVLGVTSDLNLKARFVMISIGGHKEKTDSINWYLCLVHTLLCLAKEAPHEQKFYI